MKVEVGKIVNTHGIKGEIKVQSHSTLQRFAFNLAKCYKQNIKVKRSF